MATKRVAVYEVVYICQKDGSGPAGDGSHVFRSRSKKEAEDFARCRFYHSEPAEAVRVEVPSHIASRWGL